MLHLYRKLRRATQAPDEVRNLITEKTIRNNPLVYRRIMIFINKYIKGYDAPADPLKLINVDPNNIEYSTINHFYQHEYWGLIKGGEWDENIRELDNIPYIRAKRDSLFERFKQDASWEETKLYNKYTGEGMSHNDVIDYLNRYDRLFEDIKHRYKTSFELPESELMQEVCVSIGRNGDIIYSRSGIHRLTMAQILNINKIPVRVMLRHRIWQEHRERLQERARSEEYSDKSLNLEHPDLKDVHPEHVEESFS